MIRLALARSYRGETVSLNPAVVASIRDEIGHSYQHAVVRLTTGESYAVAGYASEVAQVVEAASRCAACGAGVGGDAA